MTFNIDYNGNFAIKFTNVHEEDFDRISGFADDEDFSVVSLKDFVFEFIGDEDWFINAYAEHIGSPNYWNDYIVFTDNAVKYISEKLNVIENELKRNDVAIACGKRLNNEKMVTEASENVRKMIDDYIQAELQKPVVIFVPKRCGDIEDCYKSMKEGCCPGVSDYSIDNYERKGCPIKKRIRECISSGRPFELKRA